MEKFIMSLGVSLRISDTGEGQTAPDKPVIVLLHGYLENLEAWDLLTPQLKERARIVALDIPGHGLSSVTGQAHSMSMLADVVRSVLGSLGIVRCFMVGHSMGGYVALEFMARYPQSIEGLILLHSTPDPDSEEKKEQRLREIAIVQSGRKNMLVPSVEKAFATRNRSKMLEEVEQAKVMAEMNDEEGIVALLRGMMQRRDNNGIMLATPVPQLMIFGRHDEMITPEEAEKIIEKHPKAEHLWLENSGHMGHMEEPGTTAEAILSFINRHHGNSRSTR